MWRIRGGYVWVQSISDIEVCGITSLYIHGVGTKMLSHSEAACDSDHVVFSVGKWLACQSMDNQILIYGVHTNFRLNRKKNFRGHMVRILPLLRYR